MNFLGVFGRVVVDYMVKVPEFPKPNASIGIISQNRFFGGTGANIARMASCFGVKTSLASFVGEDFPEDFYNVLRDDKIDLADLRIVKGYPTPSCFVFTDGKNQMNFIEQGPMADAARFEVLEHSVESSRIVHIGTGRPNYYKKIVKLCMELDKEVAFDPGQEIHYVYGKKQFKDIMRYSKYLFCNESELVRARKFLDIKRTKQILDYVDVLVLTLGAKGSEIHSVERKILIPPIKPRKFVDSTGAGDAYRAGFYAAVSRGHDLKVCGFAGAAASSLIVETLGAQTDIPSWKRVIARLRPYIQHLKD
jgi:ribokinase